MIKVNLGSGNAPLPGWTNIDITGSPDILHDLRQGIPLESNSVDFVYSEHFHEHMDHSQGKRILEESFRVLKPGGRIRVATPDLTYIVEKYLSPNWRDQAWLRLPEYQYITTRCVAIDRAFREWGHCFLYDYEQLQIDLSAANFSDVCRKSWRLSSHKELSNLETREDSLLIVEATKP